MVNYPKDFPADAAQVLFSVATNGFGAEGTHTDVACFTQAMWNIQGYGLGLWKPHNHELKAGTPPRPTKLGRFTPPKGEKALIKTLVKQLAPVQEAIGDEEKPKLKGVDWSKIPWEQVIMVVTLILQGLLKKEPK